MNTLKGCAIYSRFYINVSKIKSGDYNIGQYTDRQSEIHLARGIAASGNQLIFPHISETLSFFIHKQLLSYTLKSYVKAPPVLSPPDISPSICANENIIPDISPSPPPPAPPFFPIFHA